MLNNSCPGQDQVARKCHAGEAGRQRRGEGGDKFGQPDIRRGEFPRAVRRGIQLGFHGKPRTRTFHREIRHALPGGSGAQGNLPMQFGGARKFEGPEVPAHFAG